MHLLRIRIGVRLNGSVLKQGFRPDIQGLRAVAALLVCAYHLWFGRVSGGVDVFFVVSGFLITGMLLRQVDRQGRVDFAGFWARLLKRLLPAAITVILFTSLASYLLLPKVEWKGAIKEAAAAAIYLENWLLAFDAVDYLARETPPSPFQHFWALSTQGQIYLLWPCLVAMVVWLSARLRRDVRATLMTVLAGVFGLSLAYSVYATRMNQAFAYFDTGARLWEFALGSLLAVPRMAWRPQGVAAVVAGWAGLLAVVSCGLLFQVSTVFPGYAALWPTLGALLILLAGSGNNSVWGVGTLLRTRPLQFLGSISYALYLWHWPLLILVYAYSGTREVSLVQGLAILAVSLLLAWSTTRFLERPVRRDWFPGPGPVRAFAFGAGCVTTTALVLAVWAGYTLRLQALEADAGIRVGSADYPGARALMPGFKADGAVPLPPLPGPFRIKSDLPASYSDASHQQLLNDQVRVGEYGKRDGRYVIALVGGSHSAQWLPALQAVAERQDLRILSMTKSGCWFSDEAKSDQVLEGAGESCGRWNRNLLKELERIRPDAVFTTLTRAAGTETVPSKYVEKWWQMQALGIDVIAIRDTPWHAADPALCVDVFGPANRRCQLPRQQSLLPENPAADLAGLPARLRQIDLTGYLCDAERCPPVIGNVMVYRDSNHLSASYAKTLGPALEPFIHDWLATRAPVSDSRNGALLQAAMDLPVAGAADPAATPR